MLGFPLMQPAAAQEAAVEPQPAVEGAVSRVYKSVDATHSTKEVKTF